MIVTDLQCNHRKNVPVLDEPPYFSWKMESPQENVTQTAYQIQVFCHDLCVWDSGRQESGQSTFVPYKGDTLKSRTYYQWSVTVWDNYENQATAEAGFEAAFLKKESGWKAKWVTPKEKHKKNAPPILFRKDFEVKKELASARVYATCHGIYQLSLNGKNADEREFAPENTVYETCLYYQTYDVAKLLVRGKNTLGMYVGDGWYFNMMSKKKGKRFSNYYAILFQVELHYQDGTTETIISDGDVTYSEGPIRYADLYRGEVYDARMEIDSWDTPQYDTAQWKHVNVRNFPMDNLKVQVSDPIRIYRILPVKQVLITPQGETVLDFGQNFAGRVRMRLDLPKGNVVELEHSETLDKDGNYFNNIQGILQKVVYTSNGRPSTYEPAFTFHGFRYVRVSGISNVKAEDFSGIVLTSEKEELGSFHCSDAEINRLVENCLWSQRSNMFSIPTDCPQREKAGWTGDIGVYAKTALQNEDLTAFLTSWLANMAIDQKEDGQIPPVIPFSDFFNMTAKIQPLLMGGGFKTISSSGWADSCIDVPYDMYCLTGNTDILQRQYPVMKKWLAYVETQAKTKRGKGSTVDKEQEQYLWNTGFHYGEWLIPSCCEKGGSMSKENFTSAKEGAHYVAPLYFYMSCKKMTDIAAILGKEADAEYYGALSEKIFKACQASLLSEQDDLRYKRQGAYVLALKAGIIPPQKEQAFADKLADLIKQNGGKLDTGFLGTPYLLDALSENGHEDLAYHLLVQPERPGWMYEIKNGATTIWESWNCFDANGDVQLMSMNHYAFGCVCDWIYRNITGIDFLEPGYKKIRIAPKPLGNLTAAARTFRCEYGEIESSWEIKDGLFTLQVKIPCNTTAVVELPDGETHAVGSGTYRFTCEVSRQGRS
jgi:alpha-L-rhamnosidase